MKTGLMILAGLVAFAFVGCSDSVVGADDELATPAMKKGGGGKPPANDYSPITVTFANRTGDQVTSDGRGSYADGECGVWANIGNFDDARLDPDRNYKGKLARTCGDPRVLAFQFDDGRPDLDIGAFMNIDGLFAMAVGQITTTEAQFNVCNTLVFAGVRAERTTLTSWRVTADGAGAEAVCSGDGSTHTMPFDLTITIQ